MSYYEQKSKITLKIVPHSKKDIFTLRLSKRLIKAIFSFILVCLLLIVGTLYYYYYQYGASLQRIEELDNFENEAQNLQQKNKYLKEKLSNLSKNLEKVKSQFSDIVTENQKIKKMIDFNGGISSRQFDLNIDSSKSVGYYDFESSKEPAKEFIQYTEANLNRLQEVLPKKKEDLYQLKKEVLEYKNYLAAKPQGWPIQGGKGEITSPFGYRFHPVLKERIFHDGLDIGIWYNHKIIATGKGKVIFSGTKGGYGRTVIIDHGYGYKTLYGHNNRLLVRAGQYVKRGDIVALSGNSGRSTGPHLHYEIRFRNKPVDPMKYQ